MNVIVTGCAGLLGLNFCNYLLTHRTALGINMVVGIDNLSGGYQDNLPTDEHYMFVLGDLTEVDCQKKIEQDVFERMSVSLIYHFAAYAAEGLSPFIRRFNYVNNLLPMAWLVTMAVKYNVQRFVFTSSMATYGAQTPPFSEELPLSPVDPYGIAKAACERDLESAHDQFGLEYCIIVPHNIYGRYQNIWDPYRNVLGIWMYQSLNNQPITVYGDGEQTRAFTYVDDILPCLWNAGVDSRARNQRINLGGKKEISLNVAAQLVKEITGTSQEIIHLEPRHEVKHAWCTWEKSVELLDYEERLTLKEGLQDMWEWAQHQPVRPKTYWKSYELEKNIYSYWKR